MATIIDAHTAATMVKEHDKILSGGFLACGTADNLIDELVKVRNNSLMLLKNWNIIDTSGSIGTTASQIEKLLDSLDKKFETTKK